MESIHAYMRLILDSMFLVVADNEIKDDSFEIWYQIKNPNKHMASAAAFYSRKNILPKDNYLHISFVDTETGEVLFVNCLEKLHKAMVEFKLYPEFILNGLNRTA